ncbi:hypothetical protein HRbin39_01587 [bacterium HR39]|nr:hypothetical protein HRbin39_01587 [bacterium HR39]
MKPEELRGWLGRLAGMDERAAAAVVLRAAGLRWKAVERHVGLTERHVRRLAREGERRVRQHAAHEVVAACPDVGRVPPARCRSATAERRSRDNPPGQRWWTPDAVLARLREAVDVVRRLPGPPRLDCRSFWPDIVRDPDEAAGAEPVPRRPLPTPEQVARADEVLEWLAAVDPVDAAVLWWGAAGAPWSEVGARAGLPPKWARRKWRAALYRLASDLNLAGVPVRGRPRRRAHAPEDVA